MCRSRNRVANGGGLPRSWTRSCTRCDASIPEDRSSEKSVISRQCECSLSDSCALTAGGEVDIAEEAVMGEACTDLG